MADYRNLSLKRYADDLAAKLPAPGGGSASALVACLGVSLLSMVVNFTLGKPRYAQDEDYLKETLHETEGLRNEFLNLVDLDVVAYKSKKIEDCLDVPFMICRLCFAGMKLCPGLAKKGNVNLVSDVAVAAILLESAFAAAYQNVEVNLKALDDHKRSAVIKKELSRKYKAMKRVRLKTEDEVGKIIRG
jgi:methenyltetrahydrofolate cyclohydrolase